MIQSCNLISADYPDLKCILPLAPTISRDLVQSLLGRASFHIKITSQGIYRALRACDLAMVASGTATLETAIMEVPMIILYRVSPISYWLGKMVIRVPHIGLVNLIAGEKVVPELIQGDVTPEKIVTEALAILQAGKKKEIMLRKLREIKQKLGKGGASERTAAIALQMVKRRGQYNSYSR
jgi:lipid-A-disaccharide synthase